MNWREQRTPAENIVKLRASAAVPDCRAPRRGLARPGFGLYELCTQRYLRWRKGARTSNAQPSTYTICSHRAIWNRACAIRGRRAGVRAQGRAHAPPMCRLDDEASRADERPALNRTSRSSAALSDKHSLSTRSLTDSRLSYVSRRECASTHVPSRVADANHAVSPKSSPSACSAAICLSEAARV